LQGALGELSSLKVLTDTLRSQAHEAANKLHTIVTMVEMGRAEEAVTFATNELELSQQLVDRLPAFRTHRVGGVLLSRCRHPTDSLRHNPRGWTPRLRWQWRRRQG